MKNFLLFLLAVAVTTRAVCQAPSPEVAVVQWANNLVGVTDITNCGDSRLFVTKQEGRIRIITDSMQVLPTAFLTILDSVNDTGGEQGLLGLAFDPNYATNRYFYVYYIGGTGNGYTKISRFQVSQNNPDSAERNSEHTIYTWPQPFTNHNGGDLAFGPDGYLYATLGDGGSAGDPLANGQDLSDPLGGIIRLDVSNPDTTFMVPPDNPYANATGADTLPEIWAIGLRNPFRFGFDALTGDLWIGDVGQNAYEEVDFWPAGDNSGPNFGWRCYEGLTAYNTAGCGPLNSYDAPVSVHPQADQGWCSVIGGRVYRGTQYPQLYGRYIYTDYCGGHFYGLTPDGLGGWVDEQLLSSGIAGWSSFGEDTALNIFATNINNDKVYKLYDPCPMDPPVITVNANLLMSSSGSAYWWYRNEVLIAGATSQNYEPTQSGNYSVVVNMGGGCSLESDTVFFVYTGIGILETEPLILVPNPATDMVSIGLGTTTNDASSIVLLDALGRVVLVQAVAGEGSMTLDLSGLGNGSYVVSVRNTTGREIGKAALTVAH
ncbi:MAG: PQQ-dependent sugar dehydrogenase [Flavobacteriales bacterium]